MTPKEKIEHILDKVREKARISPAGFFYVELCPILDIEGNGGIPDEAPVIFSRADQVSILRKLEKDRLLFSIEFEKDYKGAWVALRELDKESDVNPYAQSRSGSELVYVKPPHTDLGKGILCINGQSVSISTKAGKENNPLRLLKTLRKDPERYWYEDEILEDWEGANAKEYEQQGCIPRNRVYSAARTLNTKVLEGVNAKDFINFDTSKFRINPKYLDSL